VNVGEEMVDTSDKTKLKDNIITSVHSLWSIWRINFQFLKAFIFRSENTYT